MRHDFQPVVSLKTKRPIGYEALARFADGAQPAEFWRRRLALDRLEPHSRHMARLEIRSWALAVGAAIRRGLTGNLFVNVVPGVVSDPTYLRCFSRLHTYAASAGLVLIPELVENAEASFSVLSLAARKFRGVGNVAISLDDALEGSTPLTALTQLCPEWVKFDVSNLRNDPATVHAIIRSVASWGGKVIVEKVETAQDVELVTGVRVACGQGWYWGATV